MSGRRTAVIQHDKPDTGLEPATDRVVSGGRVPITELRQLRYFVMIADEGQITRAAEKLHLAQPALSQSVAQLESRLGVELFKRHARGVTLTPAGECYLIKARAALEALADAELTVQALGRAATGTIEWGFIASPPMVEAPELFRTAAAACPDLKVSFRELSFPRGTTASWLREVDIALCYTPTPHPDIAIETLRAEPRVVLAANGHPLARRPELTVTEVLDETFCGTDPSLEPVRAGFWRLDDHRGGPAPNISSDRTVCPHEVIAVVASGRAITVAPRSNAANFLRGLPGVEVVAIPLRDAHPTLLSLVWRRDARNPLVQTVVAAARSLGNGNGRPSLA
jgi:DNA-binding transcriptional LysR family regulator